MQEKIFARLKKAGFSKFSPKFFRMYGRQNDINYQSGNRKMHIAYILYVTRTFQIADVITKIPSLRTFFG